MLLPKLNQYDKRTDNINQDANEQREETERSFVRCHVKRRIMSALSKHNLLIIIGREDL